MTGSLTGAVEPAPALRPLDLAFCFPAGLDPVAPLERARSHRSPLAAFEDVIRAALQRPPCLISFSGGRDSSALLATAVGVAKRDGLDAPVPATLVFPGAASTHEHEWQATILEHLDVADWERFEIEDELDAVGPVATQLLLRHGLLWPFNTHFHAPIIEKAAGGTVVTGFGGDELGNSLTSARAERVLSIRARPRLSDAPVVGLALSPPSVRSAVYRRRTKAELNALPWLTKEAAQQIAREEGQTRSRVPLGWEAMIRQWVWRSRYVRVCAESFRVMGAYHGVSVVHPFVEGKVLDALATAGGFGGLGNRTTLLREIFGDVLPERTIRRTTKAEFTDPLWTETARTFVNEWSGEGLNPSLVDSRVLRRHWGGDARNVVSTTLLQAAWLHDHSGAAGVA